MRNTALRSPRYSNAQKEIKKYHPEIVETIWKNPTCWSLIGLYKLYMAYRIHGPSVRLRPPRFVTSQPWSPLATWRRTTTAVWVGWYLRANVGAFVGPPGMFHRGFPFTTHMLCVCVYIYIEGFIIYIHIHKNIYIHIYIYMHTQRVNVFKVSCKSHGLFPPFFPPPFWGLDDLYQGGFLRALLGLLASCSVDPSLVGSQGWGWAQVDGCRLNNCIELCMLYCVYIYLYVYDWLYICLFIEL